MKILNLTPSRKVGIIKYQLISKIESGELENKRKSLLEYVRNLNNENLEN